MPYLDRIVLRAATGNDLPPSHPAHEKLRVASGSAAFVCVGERCSLPVTEPGQTRQNGRSNAHFLIHPLKGGRADHPIERRINNHSKLTPAPSDQATRGAFAASSIEVPELSCGLVWRDTIMNSCTKAFTTSHIISASKIFALGVVFACSVVSAPQNAMAQKAPDATSVPDFAPAMIEHMQKMRRYKDADHGAQPTPRIIDRFRVDLDPKGAIASFQPNGATITSNNAFFKDMGTNGRTCFTCHQPQSGWSIVPNDVAERFERSRGSDPIFRLVDGATCPSDDVSTLRAKRRAYELLLKRGLIRVGLAIPATAEFKVEVEPGDDPYGCNNNPAIGIAAGIVSTVSTSLAIHQCWIPEHGHVGWPRTQPWNLDSIYKPGRDATLGHAQAASAPTAIRLNEIVDFQKGIFTAQIFDKKAKFLTDDNARGGPVALSLQEFFIGINDPLGLNPKQGHSSSHHRSSTCTAPGSAPKHATTTMIIVGQWETTMILFRNVNANDDWRHNDHDRDMVSEHRRSVARGEDSLQQYQDQHHGRFRSQR